MSSDFVAALLIGLIGSSHCLVMCGGIAGALQLSMSGSDVHKFGLQLCLSAGRLTTYALFGAAVGYFGVSAMQAAGVSLLWLRLVAGLLLLMMALYISRLWFGLVKLERIGQLLWRRVQPSGASRDLRVASGVSVFQISSPKAKKSVTGPNLATRSAVSAPSATTGTSIISDHH